jgi:hypothetical protein
MEFTRSEAKILMQAGHQRRSDVAFYLSLIAFAFGCLSAVLSLSAGLGSSQTDIRGREIGQALSTLALATMILAYAKFRRDALSLISKLRGTP